MPRLWNRLDHTSGRLVEEPPENPWLRRPVGIEEELLHGEAMQQIQRQLIDELLATRRFVDLKPRRDEDLRLQRLYAVDRSAPSGELLLREVAQACERMRDYTWKRILDRLDQAHRDRADAAEQELAAIAKGD